VVGFVELVGFGPRGWGLALLLAAGMTLAVAACGFVLGAVFGSIAAAAKVAGGRVGRGLADLYTTVLRGVPISS
jgi:octopine/nopaline transport system permease protein